MYNGIKIALPDDFTAQHQAVLTQYLRDDRRLQPLEWRLLYEGIDALGSARVQTEEGTSSFEKLYQRHVDMCFATAYLERLLTLTDIETKSPALIAEFARQLAPHLQQVDLLRSDVPEARLFYAYCVYWWQSFARGYAFEVQILRDLQASGVELRKHDILDPNERRSVADLIVLDLTGDVKTSTYFLRQATSQGLPNDFYVTRLWTGTRYRLLAVFQKPAAWEKIDGDTVEGQLSDLVNLLPKPVALRQGDTTLIVVEYSMWKRLVLKAQWEELNNE
jgi:hypothetical protein